MTYASETWTPTKALERYLATAQRTIKRTIIARSVSIEQKKGKQSLQAQPRIIHKTPIQTNHVVQRISLHQRATSPSNLARPVPRNDPPKLYTTSLSRPYTKTPNTTLNVIRRTSPNSGSNLVKRYQTDSNNRYTRDNMIYTTQTNYREDSNSKVPVSYLKANVKKRFVVGTNVIERSYSSETYKKTHPQVDHIMRVEKKEASRVESNENSDYEEPVYYGNKPIKL